MERKTFRMILLAGAVLRIQAQGSFQNLNFEDANLDGVSPGGRVATSQAIPGWTSYIAGNIQFDSILFNSVALDGADIGLLNSDSTFVPAGLVLGKYAVSLQSGFGQLGPHTPVSLAQSGIVPTDAKSIRFRATGPLSVSFNDIPISLSALSSDGRVNLYGGDIAAYAGETGKLRFTSNTHSDFVDAIIFSAQAVPEPSTIVLLLGGSGAFALSVFGTRRKGRERRDIAAF